MQMTTKEIEIQLALGTLLLSTKRELARDSNTPRKILEILSTDSAWGVRYCLSKNPNVPIKILGILGGDSDEMIRHNAQQTLKKVLNDY